MRISTKKKLCSLTITAILCCLIASCGNTSNSDKSTQGYDSNTNQNNASSSLASDSSQVTDSSILGNSNLDSLGSDSKSSNSTSASSSSTSEASLESASGASIPKEAPFFQDLKGLTVDIPDNWSLVSINDTNDEIKYIADLNGIEHELTLKKLNVFSGMDTLFGDTGIEDVKRYSEIVNELSSDYDMSQGKNTLYINVHAKGKLMQLLWWKKGRTPLGFLLSPDYSLFVDADSFDMYDDFASHLHIDGVEDVCIVTSEMASSVGFPFYHSDKALVADAKGDSKSKTTGTSGTGNASASDNQEKDSSQSGTAAQSGKLGPVPPGFNGYKDWEDGDESIDLTDRKTQITDNNPNYTIIKNGPGQVIRSAYPYIGVPIYPIHKWADKEGEAQNENYPNIAPENIWDPVYIRSTDRYGCPYKVDISGDIYTLDSNPSFNTWEWQMNYDTGWDTLKTSGNYISAKTGEVYHMDFSITFGYPGQGSISMGEDVTRRWYEQTAF